MKLAAFALAATLLSPMLLAQNAAPPPPPPPPPGAGAGPSGGAQAVPTPAGPLPSFLIADVHNSKNTPYPNMHGGQIFGDRYVLHQASMLDLIRTAYGLDANNIQGGPAWLERDHFEIIAKVPPHTTAVQAKLMLRQLLMDRFQLVAHTGMKPMPAWAITVKDKDKMKEAANPGTMNCKNDNPPPAPGTLPHTISLTCTNATMQWLTGLIRGWLGTTDSVIDKTNLTGVYDIHFTATPAQLIPQAGADAIPVQVALEKDLGLQLTHDTAPREVLLIDSASRKPTPNSPDVAKQLPPLPPPQFDVATIKPADPDAKNPSGGINGGQVNLHDFTLKMIVPIAWDLNFADDNAIANEPKWFETDKFDIVAKLSPDALASPSANSDGPAGAIDIDDLRAALQQLLIQRFQMKVHFEDRPIDSFRLVAAGPKMKAADPNTRTACKEGPGPDGKDPRQSNPVLNRLVTCTNMTMDDIADELQRIANGYVHNPIENATGLKGGYDFTLSFSSIGFANGTLNAPSKDAGGNAAGPNSGGGGGGGSNASDPNGAVPLQEAIQRQLGLKLEQVKRPLPVLVIDSANEKPLDN